MKYSRILQQNSKTCEISKILEYGIFQEYSKKKVKQLKKLGIKLLKLPIDIDGNLDLREALIKAKELGFFRIFLESGMRLTTNFLRKNLVDDLNLFMSNKNLGKNGKNNIKKQLKLFLKNKKSINEKVNLFGEKLITYKIK